MLLCGYLFGSVYNFFPLGVATTSSLVCTQTAKWMWSSMWKTVYLTSDQQIVRVAQGLVEGEEIEFLPSPLKLVCNLWIGMRSLETYSGLDFNDFKTHPRIHDSNRIVGEIIMKHSPVQHVAIEIALCQRWFSKLGPKHNGPTRVMILDSLMGAPRKDCYDAPDVYSGVTHLVIEPIWTEMDLVVKRKSPLKNWTSLTHLCVRVPAEVKDIEVTISRLWKLQSRGNLEQFVICIDTGTGAPCREDNALYQALTHKASTEWKHTVILPFWIPARREWEAWCRNGVTVWGRAMGLTDTMPGAWLVDQAATSYAQSVRAASIPGLLEEYYTEDGCHPIPNDLRSDLEDLDEKYSPAKPMLKRKASTSAAPDESASTSSVSQLERGAARPGPSKRAKLDHRPDVNTAACSTRAVRAKPTPRVNGAKTAHRTQSHPACSKPPASGNHAVHVEPSTSTQIVSWPEEVKATNYTLPVPVGPAPQFAESNGAGPSQLPTEASGDRSGGWDNIVLPNIALPAEHTFSHGNWNTTLSETVYPAQPEYALADWDAALLGSSYPAKPTRYNVPAGIAQCIPSQLAYVTGSSGTWPHDDVQLWSGNNATVGFPPSTQQQPASQFGDAGGRPQFTGNDDEVYYDIVANPVGVGERSDDALSEGFGNLDANAHAQSAGDSGQWSSGDRFWDIDGLDVYANAQSGRVNPGYNNIPSDLTDPDADANAQTVKENIWTTSIDFVSALFDDGVFDTCYPLP